MKRFLFLIVATTLLTAGSYAQTSETISELRVLRNAFAARQGYCFMHADLRSLFGSTSWYNEKMENRFDLEDSGKPVKPITYTAAEQAFIAKLKKREDELRQQNFKTTDGSVVNTGNIINPYQIEEFDPKLQQALARQGFATVPADEQQLFHIYERNDYHDFPSFVTTDLFLQAFHIYFDNALKQMEQSEMIPRLERFLNSLYAELTARANTNDAAMLDAAGWDAAYTDIARTLLTDKPLQTTDAKWRAMAETEVSNSIEASNSYSDFLEMNEVKFGYDIFRPRGHYTRNDQLKRYFRSMMWLQTVFFGTDKPNFLRRALLLADVIGGSERLRQDYQALFEPITYLLGTPDNITIMQVYDEIQRAGFPLAMLLDKPLKQVRIAIEEVPNKQTRIRPKFLRTSAYKINLMPQRYMPDGEVLQEMVDYDNEPTLRDVPSGLDVFAAMGVTSAERLLIDELKEAQQWPQYTVMLGRMKDRMNEINWQQNVATLWMQSLTKLMPVTSDMPYFMRTPQWQKKSLNAALASWAELKHDAILYAKQPSGAECGAGGPPEPIVRGYVEPNISYWQRAIELIDETLDTFKRFGMENERVTQAAEQLREEAEFLLNVSRKELAGKQLEEEEYNHVEYIGSTFEYITLSLIAEPDQYLSGWFEVEGADKSVAVVADVYTANADNNPNKSVLYEAVGPAHEIYVIVEIEGMLYLTRGAVLSYREFQEDLAAPRLTDEDWQEQLKTQPDKGIPNWMKEILVPLNGKEIDNEHIFYSTGC